MKRDASQAINGASKQGGTAGNYLYSPSLILSNNLELEMGIFYAETMKGLYREFPDKGLIARSARPEDVSYAAEISAIIKSPENQNKMIPLEPDQLIALGEEKRGVIVVDSNSGRIVSHAAVTYELIDRSVEVGAVCTHPDQRGRGGAWIATSG